jgi:hypothetical protein
MLGSEYGWTIAYILEQVYFDDYVELALLIKSRVLTKYRMDLAIAMNPHTEDPQELWELFDDIDTPGTASVSSHELDAEATLDKTSFEVAKLVMADNSRIIIK